MKFTNIPPLSLTHDGVPPKGSFSIIAFFFLTYLLPLRQPSFERTTKEQFTRKAHNIKVLLITCARFSFSSLLSVADGRGMKRENFDITFTNEEGENFPSRRRLVVNLRIWEFLFLEVKVLLLSLREIYFGEIMKP